MAADKRIPLNFPPGWKDPEGDSDSRYWKVQVGKASSCTGKEGFATRTIAAKVADRIGKRRIGGKINIYRCKFCGLWHVGTMPGR